MAAAPYSIVADVLPPVAVDVAYSYRAPLGVEVAPGDVVAIPLGSRETIGVVWSVRQEAPGSNLKPILGRCDLPPLPKTLRSFVDWVANWTLAPRGMVLRMAIRAAESFEAERPRYGVRWTGGVPSRATPARARVLEAASSGFAFPKSALAQFSSVSAGVIDGLIDEGVLETVTLPSEKPGAPDPAFMRPRFDPAQAQAAEQLVGAVAAKAYSTILLEGVTGSGKTEVYFEAVAAALENGRQALVLMPEIALTAQFLDRFARRFGVRPAEWHSGVAPSRKGRLWMEAATGEARVVAGARSALFLPFKDLGLIVVDEEHETAYKQEDGVAYHARDMSVVRGRLESCPVVLASATPSLETRANVARGRYRRVHLPSRFGGRPLPSLSAVDMRIEGPAKGKWISPALDAAVRSTLERGEQALLFLNRRGFAPLTLCRACGHRFQCPNCTAWLVEHRFRRALICHHCGHLEKRPEVCPSCEDADTLTACGPGIERLADEVADIFPDARTLTLSSDFPGGAERLRRELQSVARGDVDIVIGTQLVAKGHNFPQLTLVGVIDSDLGLMNGDPRAAERTFQLLQQVTGRAGRGEREGRAMLQTWQPDQPVLKALLSGDAERFYAEETESRRQAGLPPFGRLAALIVSSPDRAAAESHARALARAASSLSGGEKWSVAPIGGTPGPLDVVVLGPAEAPIAMLRGKHRFRLLARAPLGADLQAFLRALIASAPQPRGRVRAMVDIDPQSFL